MEDQNQKSLEKITTYKPPVEEPKPVVEDITPVEKLPDTPEHDFIEPPNDSINKHEPEKGSTADSEEVLKCDVVKNPPASSIEISMPKAEEVKSFMSAPVAVDEQPTQRRLNKLRDQASTVFPAGCMGCPETDRMPENVASPRRFLDAMEAKEHAGLIDNTPKKRPNSAVPVAFGRNPLTGAGVDMAEIKKTGARRKDGNPLLGEGYECDDDSKDSINQLELEKGSTADSEEVLKCDVVKNPPASSIEISMPKAEEVKSFMSAPVAVDEQPTQRRLNKLRDQASTVFPAGCMGCPETDRMPENVASPRRFLDAMEAKEHAGLIDNTPKKRPNSAVPVAFGRNPLTGAGVDMAEIKKTGARRKDGNPLLGEGYECDETDSPSPSPLAGSEPGGHKASFRSTKLAKRARSFKDDVLEKISQMRSPTNQGPKGRQVKRVEASSAHLYNKGGPIDELELQFKQLQLALKHFRGVVSKKTLQMLPGNGTIVLDTIWAINLVVQRTIGTADKTKSVKVATQRMYHSVGKVIKLCDDALIDEKCPALEAENVDEVVSQMEDSVKALIKEVDERMSNQPSATYMSAPRPSHSNLDAPAQRNSLPDIPLTPKDLEKLEDSSCPSKVVRSSHSTESILRDSSPPPKPPLPRGMYSKDTSIALTPPPLPPKKKNSDNFGTFFNSDSSIFHNSFERMSLISRSPEDSFSILSASAVSLDSMLNNSREEEEDEITAIMDPSTDNESLLESDLSGIPSANGVVLWQDDIQNTSQALQLNDPNNFHLHRLSNTDSGFMSVQSQRSSSYSKRSSQQSVVSTQWSSQQCFSASKQTAMDSEKSSSSESQVTIASVKTVSSSHSSNKMVSEFNTSYTSVDECDNVKSGTDPPPIPQKMRRRQPSPYDNVPDNNVGGELLVTCQMHQSHSHSSNTSMTSAAEDNGQPPPLPLKKRHIMAYMEMFGNCSHSADNEFLRHSVHVQGQWSQMPKPGLPTTQSCSFSHTSSHSSTMCRSTHSQLQTLTIPHNSGDSSPIPSPIRSPNLSISPAPTSTPPALPPKRARSTSAKSSPPPTPQPAPEKPPIKSLPDLLEHTSAVPKEIEETPVLAEVKPCDIDLMEKTEITQYLVFKNGEDEGPEIRGGCIDALIIQATKATKNGVFAYQEAFLTTYRTFITPFNLITKLIRRFKYFYPHPDKKPEKKKEAFALLIRVVSDLTPLDLDSKMQEMLMDFVQLLISYGEITLAKALRVKHLDRHNLKVSKPQVTEPIVAINVSTPKIVPCTLLDFKSEQIAEQMTFLDAELFMKIEIPEVLVWAEEQNEERSPNLTRFTEHFNKVSYWARTKILLAEAKDREKYCVKFIKIMKHLRKINNFNSYLALLSALDSAPIRRLEWQRHIQDGLKEYCALIDSSSSFRAYRMALADAQPPCIPYIGLVLQDLTFVHIGNSNLLQNGLINFSKRWQQYNIVENMKRFKKCSYMFKKNEKIIDFFQNFDEYITEDEMWAKSESIKPRGTRKAH